MRNLNTVIINAGDIATNPASNAIDTNQTLFASFQAVAAGSSPVGTLKIQASNDFTNAGNVAFDFTPTHWSDIPSQTVAISAAGTFLIPKFDVCYRWIRAVYTNTSGTGTVTVTMNSLGA